MEQGRLDAEAKKKKVIFFLLKVHLSAYAFSFLHSNFFHDPPFQELPPAVWQKGLAQQKQALEEAKALEEAANARIGNTE